MPSRPDTVVIAGGPPRCGWVGEDPLYLAYHDEEWGRPHRAPNALFELLILEGCQAGLSWITVLRKRAHYRKVYDGFDPARIARYTPKKIERLVADPGIVRHRGKVEASVANARAWLALAEREDPARFLWSFVDGKPKVNRPRRLRDIPAVSKESEAMSKALRKLGFGFVGATTLYAFMQATGMVDDHVVGCHCVR
jgi:DNA-3-methyladenine glycosylase I